MVGCGPGHLCVGHSLSVVLGFCSGLEPSKPQIQEPMAQRWSDSKKQKHLLCLHCELSFLKWNLMLWLFFLFWKWQETSPQVLNLVLRVAWVETVTRFNVGMLESRMLDFFLASLEVIRRGHWNFYRYFWCHFSSCFVSWKLGFWYW